MYLLATKRYANGGIQMARWCMAGLRSPASVNAAAGGVNFTRGRRRRPG